LFSLFKDKLLEKKNNKPTKVNRLNKSKSNLIKPSKCNEMKILRYKKTLT
jgi:hypothetical protein